MSPLFFLPSSYLLCDVPETAKEALFKNRFSFARSHSNRQGAEKDLRVVIVNVTGRSTAAQMIVNAEKCAITYLNTNLHEILWQPNLLSIPSTPSL